MSLPKEGFYSGKVWHQRHLPKQHAFVYNVQMLFANINNFKCWTRQSRLWSNRFKYWPGYLNDADFLGGAETTTFDAVTAQIQQQIGDTADTIKTIFVLCNARYFGYIMNPLTTYYCYNQNDELAALVALVTNTPWREQQAYAFKANNSQQTSATFHKSMTVSPFNPINMHYQWHSSAPSNSLEIQINTCNEQATIVNAAIALTFKEKSTATLRSMILGYPLHTLKVISQIYWQALRLWLKGVPFLGKHKPAQSKP